MSGLKDLLLVPTLKDKCRLSFLAFCERYRFRLTEVKPPGFSGERRWRDTVKPERSDENAVYCCDAKRPCKDLTWGAFSLPSETGIEFPLRLAGNASGNPVPVAEVRRNIVDERNKFARNFCSLAKLWSRGDDLLMMHRPAGMPVSGKDVFLDDGPEERQNQTESRREFPWLSITT